MCVCVCVCVCVCACVCDQTSRAYLAEVWVKYIGERFRGHVGRSPKGFTATHPTLPTVARRHTHTHTYTRKHTPTYTHTHMHQVWRTCLLMAPEGILQRWLTWHYVYKCYIFVLFVLFITFCPILLSRCKSTVKTLNHSVVRMMSLAVFVKNFIFGEYYTRFH